ncbi:MAG: TolC family protein [Proteobacteria bacterium]|nr:TolC family protein [Pseudomonadota bacterium]
MYKNTSRYFVIICFISITVSNTVVAKENNVNLSWLTLQIKKHPQVVAAKEAMNAQLFEAENLTKAIYNPEISGDFGNEGSNRTYTLGINQTIDRTNKRGSRKQQAVFSRLIAKKNYDSLLQNKLAEALNALNDWESIKSQSKLIAQQEVQLENLLEIVEKRTISGDLGQLDAELAYLSLSQQFGQSARVQAQLRRVETQIRELLPDWNNNNITLAEWNQVIDKSTDEWIATHPLVEAAKAQWQTALIAAEIANKNKKADPTVGLEAGKLGSDDVLSLSFSMPLYVRNNFSLLYKAANQQAMASEASYHAVRRKQLYAIKASQSALKEYSKRFQKWQTLMQGRDKNSENLLQKQWNIGDISTTEYLLTLQQRTAGLIAGIELEQEYQSALIQLLLDTAQLDTAQLNTTQAQTTEAFK